MEYTLEDALATLKDIKIERQKEADDVLCDISNNCLVTLDQANKVEDVRKKQHKFCHHLLQYVLHEEPKDYPIPKTSDLHVEVLTELEEEFQSMQQVLDIMEIHLSSTKSDISYLENKKMGLVKMKETCLNAVGIKANRTYQNEYVITQHIHKAVKRDLLTLIEILFPKQSNFKNTLKDLLLAYHRGGDNIYINVTCDILDFVHFLIEADIVMYHKNDKSKIRLTDML